MHLNVGLDEEYRIENNELLKKKKKEIERIRNHASRIKRFLNRKNIQ